MKSIAHIIRALAVPALLLLGASAHADPTTINFLYSGAAYSNSAQISGSVTFDGTLLDNAYNTSNAGGYYSYDTAGPVVQSLSLTVTGASSGNGSFGLADFSSVTWNPAGTLDLTPGQQLVGQTQTNFGSFTVDSPWGQTGDVFSGDFNFIAATSGAPNASAAFELTTNFGGGDRVALVSATTAVPEPSTYGLIGGLVTLGFVAWRRSRR